LQKLKKLVIHNYRLLKENVNVERCLANLSCPGIGTQATSSDPKKKPVQPRELPGSTGLLETVCNGFTCSRAALSNRVQMVVGKGTAGLEVCCGFGMDLSPGLTASSRR